MMDVGDVTVDHGAVGYVALHAFPHVLGIRAVYVIAVPEADVAALIEPPPETAQ